MTARPAVGFADADVAPSVGSRGDSYDNALAESVRHCPTDRWQPTRAPERADATHQGPRAVALTRSTLSAARFSVDDGASALACTRLHAA
jgi:hypothetical protein